MLVQENGRSRTVLLSEEQEVSVASQINALSDEEREALYSLLADEACEKNPVLEAITELEYETKPVSPGEFYTNPYYLGHLTLWPKLIEDLIELHEGGYEEAILSGSLGLDSIIQEADGGLPVLRDRIGKTGDVVVLMDGAGQHFSSTDAAHESGIKKCVRLTLANGMRLDLTPDHEIRSYRVNEGYVWIKAGDLSVEDLVVVARRIHTKPSSDLGIDEAKLLAYWIADGSSSETRARYCDGNEATSIEVMDLLQRLGFDGWRYPKGPRCWEVHVKRIKKSGFLAWLRGHGADRKTKEVRVPDAVCKATNEVVAAFVNRLWACEGYVCDGLEGKTTPRFNLDMSSEIFIRQVQLLLLRFGIQSRIYDIEQHDKRRDKTYRWFRLSISGMDSLRYFLSSIGVVLGKEVACAKISNHVTTKTGNTNVDTLPITRRWLSDKMTSNGLIRPVGNKWWNLAAGGRQGRPSRSIIHRWLDTYGDTSLGKWLSSEFNEDLAYERVVAIEERSVEILTGDVGAHIGNRFVANGISVHNSFGWGKSYFSGAALAYTTYQLSCLRHPQRSFGLDPISQIYLTFVGPTITLAQRGVYAKVTDMVRASPYFQDNFPPRIIKTQTWFPKGIGYIAGSTSSNAGMALDVFGGAIDEANFFKAQKSATDLRTMLDRARLIYEAIRRRMENRFMRSGRLPGLLVVDSSAAQHSSFTAHKIKEAKTNPKIFVRDYATWHVQPKERFLGKYFYVAVGDNKTRARIIEDDDEMRRYRELGANVHEVPIEFRRAFDQNLEASIQDILGLPTTDTSYYIQNHVAIDNATKEQRHPLTTTEYMIGMQKDIFHWSTIARQVEVQVEGGYRERRWIPLVNPEAPRLVHLDLSKNNDATGVAMGHIERWVEVVRRDPETGEDVSEQAPIIYIDLMLRVVPPPGKEIILGDVRALIYMLQDHGFYIYRGTCDLWQCLTGDTRVSTNRGLLALSDVRTGDTVHSMSGPQKVKETFQFRDAPLIRLTTKHGDVIAGTPSHRIWAETSKKPDRTPIWGWRHLEDIRIGDALYLVEDPVHVDTENAPLLGKKSDFEWRRGGGRLSQIDKWEFPSVMTVELAEWLGLVWGDGHINQDGIHLTVTEEESGDAADVFERLFGVRPGWTPHRDRGCGRMSISARWLVSWLNANEIRKPLIPECILRSSKGVKGAFLRGLFSADGTVSIQDGTVSLSTKHYKLAQMVRIILRTDFGLQSNLTTIQRGKHGDYVKYGEHYVVNVRGSRARFLGLIGFCYSTKRKKLEKHVNRPGRRIYSRVVSIQHERGDVYDLHVDGDHSYVANAFMSHNSLDTIQQFNAKGMDAEVVSMDKTAEPYDTFKAALYEGRVKAYHYKPWIDELKSLKRIVTRQNTVKIDHPNDPKEGTLSKDVADAVGAVVYGLTAKPQGRMASIKTVSPLNRVARAIDELRHQDVPVDIDSRIAQDRHRPAMPFLIGGGEDDLEEE
jgi:intein/homing endonuclease